MSETSHLETAECGLCQVKVAMHDTTRFVKLHVHPSPALDNDTSPLGFSVVEPAYQTSPNDLTTDKNEDA